MTDLRLVWISLNASLFFRSAIPNMNFGRVLARSPQLLTRYPWTSSTPPAYQSEMSTFLPWSHSFRPQSTEPSGVLSHVDGGGKAAMVGVGQKLETQREAVAEGRILMGEEAWGLVSVRGG